MPRFFLLKEKKNSYWVKVLKIGDAMLIPKFIFIFESLSIYEVESWQLTIDTICCVRISLKGNTLSNRF